MATALASDPLEAAELAGLRYTSDDRPGIRRKRQGRGFTFVDRDGRAIRDRAERRRIERLAIPPAWTDVWISPDPLGHLQATGRDARGRKQYRYHERWRAVRDETKYGRLVPLARLLTRMRGRVQRDLARQGVPREKVLAAVVRLLEETAIRVGNEEYARANRSFGLTTLRNRHVDVSGTRIVFRFRGKSGKEHEVRLRDGRLARIVAKLEELPGQELFQYLDDEGATHPLGSDDVNAYLREISGEDLTAKELRTWAGTVHAARALASRPAHKNERLAQRELVAAIDEVAARLGNTRAICRRCYVHPAVVEAYLTGTLPRALGSKRTGDVAHGGLSRDERAVLALLERSERRASRKAKRAA